MNWNDGINDIIRESLQISEQRREAARLREALRACLAHWLEDDDPDELQENVAKFKELCGWEDKT